MSESDAPALPREVGGAGAPIAAPVVIDGYVPGKPHLELNRFFFNVGLAGFAGWMCVAAYLVLWLKYIKKIEQEWEEYSPRAIPIATACAVGSLIACAAPPVRAPRALRSPSTVDAPGAAAPAGHTDRPPLPRCPGWHRFVTSFWPIWGLLALPIVFFLFLGVFNLAHFVPL